MHLHDRYIFLLSCCITPVFMCKHDIHGCHLCQSFSIVIFMVSYRYSIQLTLHACINTIYIGVGLHILILSTVASAITLRTLPCEG